MNNLEKIKKSDNKTPLLLCAIFIIITGGINLFGYFNLPDQIATQISMTGEHVNRMSTSLYLSLVFALVVVFSVLSLNVEKEKKIKWLSVDAVIVVANMVMIIIQL